jgi:hypothetical protein
MLPDSAHQRSLSCADIVIPSITGAWTPSTEQISGLEGVLARVLTDSLVPWRQPLPKGTPEPENRFLPVVSDYYRQYVGIIANGHRLIFINGFHRSHFQLMQRIDSIDHARGRSAHHFDWRTTPVLVCDGGAGYFSAIYDPNTRAILQFSFNGLG